MRPSPFSCEHTCPAPLRLASCVTLLPPGCGRGRANADPFDPVAARTVTPLEPPNRRRQKLPGTDPKPREDPLLLLGTPVVLGREDAKLGITNVRERRPFLVPHRRPL